MNFYNIVVEALTVLLAVAGEALVHDAGCWAAVCVGAAAVAVACHAYRGLRHTTLQAPCAWSIGSLLAVMLAVGGRDAWATAAEQIHYLAAVSTLAPFVALLGAKRPQNRAWQWIVAALLLLLALQSLKAMVIDRGAPPSLPWAWRWLLVVLLVAELLNYLPTRNAVAATLAFTGQITLLAEQLPLGVWLPEPRGLWGLGLLSAGVLAAALTAHWRSRPRLPPVDRTWLEFRDGYGALWALRVAERVNASSRQHGWRLTLGWQGFEVSESPRAGEPEGEAAAEKLLLAILARFIDQP